MPEPVKREVGLCARCRHASRVPTPRSVFWLCRLAATDSRFERYPRLPVIACLGHEPGEPEALVRLPAETGLPPGS
ncbi:MAG: hypothetical protein ACRENS_01290 [Candidatus Eiseniibacteriota bacterium]